LQGLGANPFGSDNCPQTPTPTATSTPTPTPTEDGGFCPAAFSAGDTVGQDSGTGTPCPAQQTQTAIAAATLTAMPTPTITPTPTIIQRIEQLYNVDIEGEEIWSDAQLNELFDALDSTASGLHEFVNTYDPTDSRSPAEIFNTVVAGDENIIAFMVDPARQNCITNPDTSAPIIARVNCHIAADAFTYIHTSDVK
jgi:hypothetical protein